MQNKLIFFDIDGTLSIPRYKVGEGEYVSCFCKEDWMAYCREHGENAYANCKGVEDLKTLMRRLRDNGYAVYIASICMTTEEAQAKIKFLSDNYSGLFDGWTFPKSESDKIHSILSMASNRGKAPGECILVDDTFSTLIKAKNAGIVPVHTLDIIGGYFADLTSIVA